LLAAVLLLLLIACTNVAHLMLARATSRQREMAMRASIGATPGRLLRQIVVESLTLAAGASVAGFLLAYAGVKVVAALIPPGAIPAETEIHMSVPVLLTALALTMVTTLGCGVAPALYLSGADLRARLAGKASGGTRHSRFRAALVITEVALSVVLL